MGNQIPQDTSISASALVVALVALIIATAQLLGQYFATADGYRRCQAAVMGAWARHTRLKWRWSQFRFETLFTTPEIVLLPMEAASFRQCPPPASQSEDLKWIATPESPTAACRIEDGHILDIGEINVGYLGRKQDRPNESSFQKGSSEMACWLPFLQSLRQCELQMFDLGCYSNLIDGHSLRRPACRFVQSSWDAMSPELVYPLAITSVGDIAIMVQRLGMKWLTFQPEDGLMRAEGHGLVIYSTLVRSIGPILHFSGGRRLPGFLATTKNSLKSSEISIVSGEADMMRFGLLPVDKLLLPDLEPLAMGTIDEVKATLDVFDPTGRSSKKVRDNRQFEPTATFGFSDLLSMTAPMLRRRRTTINRLPVPTEHSTGLTYAREGFVVFRGRLVDYIGQHSGELSEQINWVAQQYDKLKERFCAWENDLDAINRINSQNLDFLEDVHRLWDYTTAYFRTLAEREKDRLGFFDLVSCHTQHAVNFWHEAHERMREGKMRGHYGVEGLRDWLAEGMHMYWDYLPSIAAELSRNCKVEQNTVHEAWIMLLFRAFCWSRCHFMCASEARYPESTRLPSRYWNSKMPVYLG